MKKLRILYICMVVLAVASGAMAGQKHRHSERWYQSRWCAEAGGVMEYILDDRARVDCLTDEYAIEFDFAPKWAESIGQALYYAIKTDRQPGVVLIMERPVRDARFLRRLEAVAEKYNIKIWTIK